MPDNPRRFGLFPLDMVMLPHTITRVNNFVQINYVCFSHIKILSILSLSIDNQSPHRYDNDMNNGEEIRADVNFSRMLTSNMVMPYLMTQTNKNTSDSLTDFALLIELLPKDTLFSRDGLRAIAIPRFRRLFIQTTYKNKKIIPFDFFFDNFTRFYHDNPPLIKSAGDSLYTVNNFSYMFSVKYPHLNIYNVRLNDKTIEAYSGNMSQFAKDCAWKCLERICKLTKHKAIFTHQLVKSIFGLSKRDIKNYLKKTKSTIQYEYRTIGREEQKDLGLSNPIGRKHKRIIKGYRFVIMNELECPLEEFSISLPDLYTIKVRIEHEQYKFSVAHYHQIKKETRRQTAMNQQWSFHVQHERLGFSCVSSTNSRNRLLGYLETISFGTYKQMRNIYTYLKKKFTGDPDQFKYVYRSIVGKFVFQ